MSDTEEFTDSDVIADRVLNDIEIGDTITVETEYSFELTGTVTKQEITIEESLEAVNTITEAYQDLD